MKNLLPLFIALLLFSQSCKEQKAISVDFNTETIIDDEKLLLGPIDKDGLKLAAYQVWFDSTYLAYKPKTEIKLRISDKLSDVSIKVFLGTWCSDSQREIPAFYKIMDELKFDEKQLDLIAVDRTKKLPTEYTSGYEIDYVPTFIFYKNEKEIGRIIESPVLRLEEDILAILNE